jgi:hypothetical protein
MSKRLFNVNIANTDLAAHFRHSVVAVWKNLPDDIRNCININIFYHKLEIHSILIFRAARRSPCLRIAPCATHHSLNTLFTY